jgi:hypothetical protein
LSIILLVACGESASVATNPAVALSTSSTTSSPTDPSIEELRELALAYWEAFNAYDADQVLAYLEENYRATREETIRSEVGQISTFGVKLGVQEQSPPVLLSDDTAEMFLDLKNPLGVRRIRMAFERIDGYWSITFAQETD